MVRRSALPQCVFFISCVLLVLGLADPALAQFGLNRGAAAPEVGGFAGWILAEQAKFYLQLSQLIRAAKADGSAAWSLRSSGSLKASARDERMRKSTSIPVSSSRLFDSSRWSRIPSWAISAMGPGMPAPLKGLNPP